MSDSKRYFDNNLSEKVELQPNEQKKRTLDIVAAVVKNLKNDPQNVDGGLYVGLGGISYMFYHLAKHPSFSDKKGTLLQNGLDYLTHPIQDVSRILASGRVTERTGFLTGAVGICAVGAVLYSKLGHEGESQKCLQLLNDAAQILLPVNWSSRGGDELFVGRAGFLCAVLWLRREIGGEIVPEGTVFKLLDAIIESGRNLARTTKSIIPLMYQYHGTLYIGPAHGLSGIILMLLRFPTWLQQRPEAVTHIKNSLDGLLNIQQSNGNFPSSMDEIGNSRPSHKELVHWCHGAPGVVYVMGMAYKVFGDEKYLNSALRCGEVTWQKGLLKKGPGICHGLAGSGYVFLLLYRLTKNNLHLQRAISFMEFYYTPEFQRAHTPDCPFSLYEGTAGLACFAGDLLHPDTSEFPFFSID